MMRNTPTRERAEGMLAGILAQRRMYGLTGPNPYGSMDLRSPSDRRIVGSVYAAMVRDAMGGVA